MSWLNKVCIVAGLLLLLTGVAAPFQAQANSNDLTRVSIIFKFDNPDYFWRYPFLGKHLDQITISSFGKTFTIPSLSDADKMEIDVPTNYYLRLNIHLQSEGTTLKTIPYTSKHRVRSGNTTFTIVLKAPDPQSIKILSDDFEAVRP